MKAKLVATVLVVFFLVALALGQSPSKYKTLPKPQPVAVPGKIEVIEFFWYQSAPCRALEPSLEQWTKTLAKDVVFRREHIFFDSRADMVDSFRLFATLNSMGLVDKYQARVMRAMDQNVEIHDQNSLFDWVASQGIDKAKFSAAYRSFNMSTIMEHSARLTKSYGVDSVPIFIVNGKFAAAPTASPSGGLEPIFPVLDKLIASERSKSTGSRSNHP